MLPVPFAQLTGSGDEIIPVALQPWLRDFILVLVAGVAGYLAGGWVVLALRSRGFDELGRVPWKPWPGDPAARGGGPAASIPTWPTFSLSSFVRGLVTATVWGAGVWILAWWHNAIGIAQSLQYAAERTWLFAVIALVALVIGRALAGAVLGVLYHQRVRSTIDKMLPAESGEPFTDTLARVLGTLIYATVMLLVLLVVADLFGWTRASSALSSLWMWILNAATAIVIVAVGWFGVMWAYGGEEASKSDDPALQRGRMIRLAAVTGTTLVAILFLTNSLAAVIGLAIVGLGLALVWPARPYLPDVWAGAYLAVCGVRQVILNDRLHKISEVRMVMSRVSVGETSRLMRNSELLTAIFKDTETTDTPAPESAMPGDREPKTRPAPPENPPVARTGLVLLTDDLASEPIRTMPLDDSPPVETTQSGPAPGVAVTPAAPAVPSPSVAVSDDPATDAAWPTIGSPTVTEETPPGRPDTSPAPPIGPQAEPPKG